MVKLKLVYTENGVSYPDHKLERNAEFAVMFYKQGTQTTFKISSILFIEAIISAVIRDPDISVDDIELRFKGKSYPLGKRCNMAAFWNAPGLIHYQGKYLDDRLDYRPEEQE